MNKVLVDPLGLADQLGVRVTFNRRTGVVRYDAGWAGMFHERRDEEVLEIHKDTPDYSLIAYNWLNGLVRMPDDLIQRED